MSFAHTGAKYGLTASVTSPLPAKKSRKGNLTEEVEPTAGLGKLRERDRFVASFRISSHCRVNRGQIYRGDDYESTRRLQHQKKNVRKMDTLLRRKFVAVLIGFFLSSTALANPTAEHPLEANSATKEIKIFAVIYPQRFNAAQGEEARYHLVVWKGGTSADALIETPADDLAFHEALVSLGAHPGDNLTMASWNKRHDPEHPAPREKVTGSPLEVRLTWANNPTGLSIDQALQTPPGSSPIPNPQSPIPSLEWRFGGNRDRWFNKVPLAPRPGCLLCLYSCPSGKVSNSALSVHDYVTTPSRFEANLAMLPPDGTPVIVTVRVTP